MMSLISTSKNIIAELQNRGENSSHTSEPVLYRGSYTCIFNSRKERRDV